MNTKQLYSNFIKSKNISILLFIFIGILNTSFSYAIYSVFLFFGFTYQLSNLFSLIAGILFSFKTQGYFVFKNSDNRLLGRFIFSWIIIYLCVIVLIGKIIYFGFNPYIAGAISLPFSVTLSYVSQKYFVFRKSRY
jgi:putative flippase GtrA